MILGGTGEDLFKRKEDNDFGGGARVKIDLNEGKIMIFSWGGHG